jgi:hypothetical protein
MQMSTLCESPLFEYGPNQTRFWPFNLAWNGLSIIMFERGNQHFNSAIVRAITFSQK